MLHYELTKRVFHFRRPAGTSRGVYLTRTSWFVRLTCDSSQGGKMGDGVGECAPLPDLSCDSMPDDEYERTLRAMCERYVETGEIPYEALRPYPSMLFGLETAHAQMLGLPPFDRATPFSRGEEGIPINGLVWMGTFEEMYARVVEKLDAGFHCVKLKIGAIDWSRELQLIRFVRERFSRDEVELRLDANGGFTTDVALQRLEELAKYDIHSIEQPIAVRQWSALRELCDARLVPIALDEELIGVNDVAEKARLLDAIRPQYIILKPSLHGGMRGCIEWISLARERGIGSWMTSALESNVGLRAISLFAAQMYDNRGERREERGESIVHSPMPQGLGTGQLFTDNIPMGLQVRGERLWMSEPPMQL